MNHHTHTKIDPCTQEFSSKYSLQNHKPKINNLTWSNAERLTRDILIS
ncbi:hypothetical protein [Candidatus Erwinia haradaeae]|nr:hypothetical protein [Candidatus Erwinia haradaeae]